MQIEVDFLNAKYSILFINKILCFFFLSSPLLAQESLSGQFQEVTKKEESCITSLKDRQGRVIRSFRPTQGDLPIPCSEQEKTCLKELKLRKFQRPQFDGYCFLEKNSEIAGDQDPTETKEHEDQEGNEQPSGVRKKKKTPILAKQKIKQNCIVSLLNGDGDFLRNFHSTLWAEKGKDQTNFACGFAMKKCLASKRWSFTHKCQILEK